MAIQISDNIASASRTANLDAKFGPYTSRQDVIDHLVADGSDIQAVNGLTVGVIEDNNVVEYVFKNVPANPTASNVTVNNLFLKQAASVEVDSEPEEDSPNPVSSGGVYSALQEKANTSDIHPVPAISTNIEGDASSDNKTASPKAVKTYVDGKVSSAYKAAGTASSVSNLGSLDASHEGFVYNMSAEFTTTADFVEGAGKTYLAGTNVAIVNVGTTQNPSYKYDVLTGFVDLSGKADKSEMSVTDGTGADEDKVTIQLKSGTSATVLKQHQDISGKVDKVANAQENNFASFDSNGGLQESNCNEGTFIKGVQQNGVDLKKDEYGKVNVTVQDGVTPHIDQTTKHWMIGEEDTGVDAEGKDAYQVYVASVPQGETPMMKTEWLASLKGEKGDNAPQPFKGWLTPLTKPTSGKEGDYCYVTDNGVTNVYKWNGTIFEQTSDVPDTDHTQSFASSESVNQVAIDNSGLVNPVNTADSTQPVLAKAEDVMQLKAKLEGVTASEVKASYVAVDGYKVQGNGALSSNSSAKYTTIPLNGAKSVRFLCVNLPSSSSDATKNTGYCFGHYDGEEIEANWVIDTPYAYEATATTSETKECVAIPSANSTHFRTNVKYSRIDENNFYCYLQSGNSAVTQEQLAEVRNAMPVVESFANKTANNIVLNEAIVKQLSLDEYDKIDVDVSDFNDGLPYYMNPTTLKFGTNENYKHAGIYATGGDIIEINGGEVDINFYFLTSLEYSNGGDIPIVTGTVPIPVKSGSRCILQAPIGTKCIAFFYRNSSNNTFVPQSLTIYRKKSSYDSKVYTADDYIMCNYLSASSGNIAFNHVYSKCFVIPIKSGFKYALMLSNVGTANKILYYLNRLPNIGDSYDNTVLGWDTLSQSNIATTFTPTYDGFLNIIFKDTSYTADNISLVAVKSTVDMSDFVAPMLSKLKFNTPQYTVKSGGIYAATNNSSGLFTTSKNYKHILLRVATNDIVVLKKGTNVIRYAFLKDDTLVNETLANFADGTGPMVSNSDVLEIVPPTANYLYIQNSYKSTSCLPSYIGILADNTNAFTDDMQNRRDYNIAQAASVSLSRLNVQVDENGWEIPATLQQLNAQKKAEQLCKIKWTPKYNVPSKINPYYYDANVEQTSIPYSSNNDDGSKTVGEEVTLHTYMTAVNNPFSLMYTECVCNGNGAVSVLQKSAWGKIYTKSNNGYAYYGTVCCGLTSSVENVPLKWNNYVIRNYLRTNGLYIQICPTGTVDFNLLQIGDVADNMSHSFLVYGLHRDANGNVDKVKISESSSGHRRGKCIINNGENRDNFISRVYGNGRDPFTLFRYVKLWNNTDYEPSEYVPLTDRGEIATEVTYNDAICTFAGDKATFRSDDLVVINYNLNGTQPHNWTKIKVYKDDVLLGEYTLAEAEATLEAFYTEKGEDTSLNGFNVISQHNHALVLGTELAAGIYKACMTDGTNDSDFTYWEIIPNTITVVEQGYDSYKVNVSGGFLEAIYVGNAYYLPTYDEQATNEFIIHPIALMQAWGLSYDGIDVRVKLKGKYGSVTTVGAIVIEGDAPEPEP